MAHLPTSARLERVARWSRLPRAEMRRQLRRVARLRAATIVMIVFAVVSAPVAYFAIREAARDPVFVELDGWDLPQWAAATHRDEAYGSRWCFRECRFRERTWTSDRPAAATNPVYTAVLSDAGWTPWNGGGCPGQGIQGWYSCWQRDENVLDLWVRDAPCEVKPMRPTVGPTRSPATGSRSASASPSDDEPAGVPEPGCGTSDVTVKVFNRVAYQRGT